MALINCSECGNQVNEGDNVCQNCGNPLNQNVFNTEVTNKFNQEQEESTIQKILCDKCGNQVNESDNICQNCGNLLSTFNETEQNEILENVEKIKVAADTINILLKGMSVILFLIGFIYMFQYGDGPTFAIFFGIIGFILLIISNFIKVFIKWKAYMLETNYKISINTENDKNGFNKL